MISKSTAKYIQSLQQKKFRDEHSEFIAEGPKLVSEFLAQDIFELSQVLSTEKGLEILSEKIKNKYAEKIITLKEFEFEKLSALSTPNHLLAVFKKPELKKKPLFKNKITLVLDDVQDPGNLGTIIRNADWFGVENIFCSKATADAYNPKVVQSTMASLGRVNIVYTDVEKMLNELSGIKKYAAVLGGKDLKTLGKIREGIIIIGNESKGISNAVQKTADEKITIQKFGAAESLNAGVATGIILYSITGTE
jgi:RNA methyltransferase, TrmH family